jgi:hydroxymethylbilane synthase
MEPQPAEPDKKNIFISRSLAGHSPLQQLRLTGHRLHAESLISISQIRFTHTPRTGWIFFSSKNAIRYFFAQNPQVSQGVKYGVMSSSSAQFLQNYGVKPEFTGSGVDVTKIARDFAAFVGNETVLLPQAIDSLQTIQKQLSFSNNCTNLFVYKTKLRTDFSVPHSDILVFTSPSNAKAYFEKYRLLPGQETVAIGSTTAAALRDFGAKQVIMPDAFNEQSLLEVLLGQTGIKHTASAPAS